MGGRRTSRRFYERPQSFRAPERMGGSRNRGFGCVVVFPRRVSKTVSFEEAQKRLKTFNHAGFKHCPCPAAMLKTGRYERCARTAGRLREPVPPRLRGLRNAGAMEQTHV